MESLIGFSPAGPVKQIYFMVQVTFSILPFDWTFQLFQEKPNQQRLFGWKLHFYAHIHISLSYYWNTITKFLFWSFFFEVFLAIFEGTFSKYRPTWELTLCSVLLTYLGELRQKSCTPRSETITAYPLQHYRERARLNS